MGVPARPAQRHHHKHRRHGRLRSVGHRDNHRQPAHSHHPCTRRTRPLAPGPLTQPTTAQNPAHETAPGPRSPGKHRHLRARFPLSMPKPAHQAPAQLTVRFARPPSPGGGWGRAAFCSDTLCGPLVGRRPTRLSAAQAAAHHQPPPQPSIALERPAEPCRAPAWHRRERPQPAPGESSPQLEAGKAPPNGHCRPPGRRAPRPCRAPAH